VIAGVLAKEAVNMVSYVLDC